MAAKHILSLEVLNVSNTKYLSIKDTSKYAKGLGTDCPELLITPPAATGTTTKKTSIIEVQPGFDLNITACCLNLQQMSCNEIRTDIPDGVYVIKYQLSPHDKTYVEYNFLRTTGLMKLYYEKLCKLDMAACEPDSSRKKLYQELNIIRMLIDGAKSKVEYCSQPDAGMELFNYAKKKLERIVCKQCDGLDKINR
tara:strand:- start:48 stop:632 length:585 start_codon:yes stop_codon:yes gene_type:complete